VDQVELGPTGIVGDRRFYLIDETGHLTTTKRAPRLVSVRPEVEGDRIRLHFPDGEVVEGDMALGEAVETIFYGRQVAGRLVEGAWNDPLSALAGKPLRLVRTEHEGDGQDRGGRAGATLVSTASLEALRAAADAPDPVDGRRFRMTIGVEGIRAHAEDDWIGRRLRAGSAVVAVRGNVGRCVVTKTNPDSGARDFETLDAIAKYRGDVETTEPLPFGVWCEVVEPGRVALGDPVEPLG
jgi:uncharacterized protein YcbX